MDRIISAVQLEHRCEFELTGYLHSAVVVHSSVGEQLGDQGAPLFLGLFLAHLTCSISICTSIQPFQKISHRPQATNPALV